MAKVKDITSIENVNDRLHAERICITIAKNYIKNHKNYMYGKDYIQTIKNVENEFPK
jgi:5-methylthioribose kinase